MDLYAVGVVAFEMLTGRLPFIGDTVVEVLMKHAEEAPPKPSSILMSLPDDVDDLVLKLLAKKPEQRYRTAEQVRAQVVRLRKALSDSTARVKVDDTTLPPRMQRLEIVRPAPLAAPAKSSRGLVLGLIGLLLGAIALLLVLWRNH